MARKFAQKPGSVAHRILKAINNGVTNRGAVMDLNPARYSNNVFEREIYTACKNGFVRVVEAGGKLGRRGDTLGLTELGKECVAYLNGYEHEYVVRQSFKELNEYASNFQRYESLSFFYRLRQFGYWVDSQVDVTPYDEVIEKTAELYEIARKRLNEELTALDKDVGHFDDSDLNALQRVIATTSIKDFTIEVPRRLRGRFAMAKVAA